MQQYPLYFFILLLLINAIYSTDSPTLSPTLSPTYVNGTTLSPTIPYDIPPHIHMNENQSVLINQWVNIVGVSSISVMSTDQFGQTMTIIRDLDDNGINDFIIGVPYDDDGGTDKGAIYILLSSDSDIYTNGIKTYIKISATVGSFNVPPSFTMTDNFGTSVTALTDMNHDSIDEIAVGHTLDPIIDNFYEDGKGSVYLLVLKSNLNVKTYYHIEENSEGFTAILQTNEGFGRSLADAIDLDNNDVIDLIVGADQADSQVQNSGAFYILFLNSLTANNLVKTYYKILSYSDTNIYGGSSFSYFGWNLDMIGGGGNIASVNNIESNDLDLDDSPDLIVGSPGEGYYDGQQYAGSGVVYILFLTFSNNQYEGVKTYSKIDAGDFPVIDSYDHFGNSVSSIGFDGINADLDGDKVQDIIVGAPKAYDDKFAEVGGIYIISLTTFGTVKTYSYITKSHGFFDPPNLQALGHFGFSVASFGGDINNDNFIDIIVGSPDFNSVGPSSGTIFVSSLTNCSIGTYSDGLDCPFCPPGEYSDTAGVSQCVVCISSDWCLGGNECKSGHTGRGCTQCIEGYYFFNESCQECPTSQFTQIIILIIAILFFIYFIYRLSNVNISMTTLTVYSEVIMHFQIVGLLLSINISYPDLLIDIGNIFDGFFGLNPIEATAPECQIKMTFWDRWLLMVSFPLIIVFPILIYLITEYLPWNCKIFDKILDFINRRKVDPDKRKESALRFISLMASITFLYSCEQIFSIYPCSEYDGEWYLDENPDTRCLQNKWIQRVMISVVYLLFYIVGTIVLFWAILKEKIHVISREKSFGWLFLRYKEEFWYWEILLLIKKAILTGITIFFWKEPTIQLIAIVVIEGIVALYQKKHNPFRNNSKVNLEIHIAKFLSIVRVCLTGISIISSEYDSIILDICIIIIYIFGILISLWGIYKIFKLEGGFFKSFEIDYLKHKKKEVKDIEMIREKEEEEEEEEEEENKN